MLVLTRKANESLAIDWLGRPELGQVTMNVLEVRGERVQIGLDGPDDVRFLRTEMICASAPAPGVAEVLCRVARLLDNQQAGQNERDALLLSDTAAHLRVLAGDQP